MEINETTEVKVTAYDIDKGKNTLRQQITGTINI